MKSLEEIKNVLKKFKNASGVGFAITPQLIQIAKQVGLIGYGEAMARWLNTSFYGESVGKEAGEVQNGLQVNYDGPSLCYSGTNIFIGIKRTIEDIELKIKGE